MSTSKNLLASTLLLLSWFGNPTANSNFSTTSEASTLLPARTVGRPYALKEILFSFLVEKSVFSEFDLKSGFYQINNKKSYRKLTSYSVISMIFWLRAPTWKAMRNTLIYYCNLWLHSIWLPNAHPDKCDFVWVEISFLGQLVSSSVIHPNTAKVECTRLSKASTIYKNVRSFLCLVGTYGKFIKDWLHDKYLLYVRLNLKR